MLLPLPYLGATITCTTCSCSQDRCNEALRPAAEESGSGLAAPCSRWLWMWPLHLDLLCFGPLRVFMFAAPVSAMPALTELSFPQPEFDWSTFGTIPNVAIINSLGATKLRLVAPSARVPSFSFVGRGHRLVCLPIALPNYSFRAEWRKLLGGQARVCNAESANSSNPP